MLSGIINGVGAAVQAARGWGTEDLLAKLAANDPSTATVNLLCARLGEDAFVRVARALATNRSCERLDVPGTGVGDAFAQALGEALRSNATLRTVRAFDTNIGDAGARHLAEGLKANATLEELNLSNTRVGDAGASALAEMIPANRKLRILDLEFTPITDTGARMLRDAAARSQSLKELKLLAGGVAMSLLVGGSSHGASSSEAALAAAACRRFRGTRFFAAYAEAARFATEEELFAGIARIIEGIGTKKGVSAAQQKQLIRDLVERDIGRKAEGDARIASGIAWTSASTMETKARSTITFYGAIQELLRDDEKGALMVDTARYCRTFNGFLVARRIAGAPAAGLAAGPVWAFENDAGLLVAFNAPDSDLLEAKHAQGEMEFQTRDLSFNVALGFLYTFNFQSVPMTQVNHTTGKIRTLRRVDASRIQGALPQARVTARGAWLPKRFAEFFTQGLVYRYAGYLPSADNLDVAEEFLESFRPRDPEDARNRDIPVKFIFHFDGLKGCDHVNLLEKFTMFPGEREWLFQHYSAFRVRTPPDFRNVRAAFPVQPVIIEVDVIANNRDVSEDVPLAKWH